MIEDTKPCRHCLAPMSAAASVCAACGRRQSSLRRLLFWGVAILVVAFAVLNAVGQAIDPLDIDARHALDDGEQLAAKYRLYQDPNMGKVVDPEGRASFQFGQYSLTCGVVKEDPLAKGASNSVGQRAITGGWVTHFDEPSTAPWFNHLWRKGGC